MFCLGVCKVFFELRRGKPGFGGMKPAFVCPCVLEKPPVVGYYVVGGCCVVDGGFPTQKTRLWCQKRSATCMLTTVLGDSRNKAKAFLKRVFLVLFLFVFWAFLKYLFGDYFFLICFF